MSRARKPQARAHEWRPLERAVPVPPTAAMTDAVRELGMDPAVVYDPDREVWRNDRYIVHVDRRADGSVARLSIRRDDRKPARDWREFQRIKNEIAGEEVEAVELYPAQSRVVDTANHYWLWCCAPGVQLGVGFEWGKLADDTDGMPGAVQRPLPADWAVSVKIGD